ncbi:syndecan-4-like isoform X1 [Polyodon spathula]|uniref:syndecan-4-like isoform X1 n=1 Tax=Polyodon spathula TaxID=7913 RepID=UPI001B7EAE49|nr:syndecan-4-like isoform X1 [Polyodon spathula]
MQKLCALLVLFFLGSVYTESQVRETETWFPSEQKSDEDLEVSSGDSPNSSDFGFMNQDDLDTYDDDEDNEDYDGSGSGDKDEEEEEEDEVVIENPKDYNDVDSKSQPDFNSNRIPEDERTVGTNEVNDKELVSQNEVGVRSKVPSHEVDTNVLMASTSNESVFERTEVLAALIAGGVVGLVFAVLLVILLIHRMKKKDEGSYELAKKPIYTKAPTAEIYA